MLTNKEKLKLNCVKAFVRRIGLSLGDIEIWRDEKGKLKIAYPVLTEEQDYMDISD